MKFQMPSGKWQLSLCFPVGPPTRLLQFQNNLVRLPENTSALQASLECDPIFFHGKNMNIPSSLELRDQIVEKATSLGASVAGIARVQSLKESPSHRIYPKIGMNLDVHWKDRKGDMESSEVAWPEDAVSAVVIGVAHNVHQPELDWWDGKGTPGNRILMGINRELSAWIEKTFDVKTYKLPYLIEKGGIFLKDAAVMAGLGCVGKNNMVITPQHGPRIRFRALLLNMEAEVSDPLEFYPCQDCWQPCRAACPVSAFANTVYSAAELDQSILPGTDGSYDRVTCNLKMGQDIEDAVKAMQAGDEEHQEIREWIDEFEEGIKRTSKTDNEPAYCVKYCRKCELSCPVGR
jgi:epoxyqueuosine reductase